MSLVSIACACCVRVAAIFGTEERHETAMLGTEQSGAAIFGTEERHQAAILGGKP